MNVAGKRCAHLDGCSKGATCGLSGGSRTRCVTHKEPGHLYNYRCNVTPCMHHHDSGCSIRGHMRLVLASVSSTQTCSTSPRQYKTDPAEAGQPC